MSGLKALRNRIKSVKSTQKITKAMRMVSAAKLNRAKDAASFASTYREKILSILSSAKQSLDISELDLLTKSMMLEKDSYKNSIVIIYGSDRGLCGAYNSGVMKKFRREISNYPNVQLITIGKKISEFISKFYTPTMSLMANDDPSIISEKIRNFIVSELEKENATQVVLFYTKFKNAITQIPSFSRIIPLEANKDDSTINNVEFEGDSIIKKLAELHIESNIVANLYESKASEEASRMTAMDNATRNAGEMINKLTLKMNRTRQAQITKELIEVISGAEAV